MNSMDVEVIRSAMDWMNRGHRVVLGTVVRTWGSSPRPPGSLMIIRDDGQVAGSLSGGEQQMLAIARAMMARPRLILLDEPSEGIMPLLVREIFELFRRMKRQGTTLVLVEQNVERALQISDRAYILDQGRIVHHGAAEALLADREIQERYCAV